MMIRFLQTIFIMALVATLLVAMLSWGRLLVTERKDPLSAIDTGRWVQAGDVKMHIQEYGSPSSPTLVLVHGTGAWSQTWVSNADAMVAAGYHVVAVDLPPFGFSTRPENVDYSRHAQARRIVSLVDELKAGPVTLLGHSYGGGPAAEAAMMAPDRIKHLILLDAAIGMREEPMAKPAPPGLVAKLFGMRTLRTTLIALVGTQPVFSQALLKTFVFRKEVVTAKRTAIYQEPFKVKGFSASLGDWAFQFASENGSNASETKAGFAALQMPLTLIWGEEDTITPLAQAKAIQEAKPGSKLVILKRVGHIPQIEDVDQFNEAIQLVLKPVG
jgi:pimeloyl-ACP methyl ester carboxylesterase